MIKTRITNKSNWPLFVLILLYCFLIYFRMYAHSSIVFRAYIYSFILIPILLIKLPHNKKDSKRFIALLLYGLAGFLYFARGGIYPRYASLSSIILELSYFACPFLLFLFYDRWCDIIKYRITFLLLLALFLFVGFVTIPLVLQAPYMVREQVYNPAIDAFMESRGAASYAMPHTVIFLLPVFVYAFKTEKRIAFKAFLLIIISFIIWFVYLCGASSPLILGLMGVVLAFFIDGKKTLRGNISRLLLITLPFLIILNNEIIESILSFLSDQTVGLPFHKKIEDFRYALVSDSEDASALGNRNTLYAISIDAFFYSPLIGDSSSYIGRHSFLLDVLGSIGILGFVPMMVYLISITKEIYYRLPDDVRAYYVIGVLLFFIQAGLKTVFGVEFFFIPFFVLPCLAQYFSKDLKKN